MTRRRGRFCLLAKAVRARQVLELGSGYGYSAYWFAKGIEPEGRTVCTDRSRENATLAREFFAKRPLPSFSGQGYQDNGGFRRALF